MFPSRLEISLESEGALKKCAYLVDR